MLALQAHRLSYRQIRVLCHLPVVRIFEHAVRLFLEEIRMLCPIVQVWKAFAGKRYWLILIVFTNEEPGRFRTYNLLISRQNPVFPLKSLCVGFTIWLRVHRESIPSPQKTALYNSDYVRISSKNHVSG